MNERAAPPALRRLKPYPAYKDSGIEWLGEIPAHWTVTRLKRIGSLQAGAGFPEDEQGLQVEELPFFKVGDMGSAANDREMNDWQHTISEATARRLRAFVFPARTIVFAKVGAALLLNRRRLLTRRSCLDNNMMGFMPGACDITWVFYWLSGLDLARLANPGAVPSVNEGQMRDTPVVLPPADEQRAIAAFLDRETARIDALVAKKERLIELLQEKRTAMITRAVTKGLDPTVPMKDSGVEWLGEIPAHWEVRRVKFVAELNPPPSEVRGLDPDAEVSFVPMEAVGEYGGLDLSRTKPVAEIRAGYTYFGDGDVIVAKITPCFENGKCALAAGLINGVAFGTTELHVLRALDTIDRKYLFYGTLADAFRRLGEADMYGAGGQKRVAETFVKNLKHPMPPIPEQRAIATFLDRETAKIDALIAKVRDAIEHLKELRTALISAAVTGKIDVREEAA